MSTKKYPKVNIGIGSLVIKNDKKILLVKRKKKPDVWAIPGGYMGINETLFETAIREVLEETNIVIKPKGIIAVRQRITLDEGNNFWILTIADYKSGYPIPDNKEIFEAEFMSYQETMKQNILPNTRKIINLLKSNKLQIHKIQRDLEKNNYLFFI